MIGQCGKKHFGNIRFPKMVVLTRDSPENGPPRFYKFSLRIQEVFTCTSRTTTFTFSGGPHLSAKILKGLGDFGIPLWLDTYSAG